jgi:hypothetical protein
MDVGSDDRDERLRFSIDLLDRTGRFVEPTNVNLERARAMNSAPVAPTVATQGCADALHRLFVRISTGMPPPPSLEATDHAATTDVGAAAALAGKPKRGKAFKLAQAVESVQARCAGLEDRAVALRAQVARHLAEVRTVHSNRPFLHSSTHSLQFPTSRPNPAQNPQKKIRILDFQKNL